MRNPAKHLRLLFPYLFFGLYATKLSQAWRLAEGASSSQKLLHLMDALNAALQSPYPSFHPADLLVGTLCGAALWLAVRIKAQNAKKYRHGAEYGTARWGTAKDIRPYMDDAFENNVILTATEGLTMNSRPKDPKTARNKNVLIIGGSGSGKTRFWLKPNLMQCVSAKYPVSFVVTDPKGYTVLRYTTVNDACYQFNSRKGARLVWHSNRKQKSLLCMNVYLVTTSYRVRATVS